MSEKREKIIGLGPWFHNIHLPDGEQTAPDHFLGDFPHYKWESLSAHIPLDLTGVNVLDIGCNAGFYSIELAKRGAQVMAIDLDEHYLKQAEWVAQEFDLQRKITFKHLQVYDLARVEEKFDLVWFMGVFYHLRYPLLALDILSEKCKDMIVFQTLTIPGETAHQQVHDLPIHDRDEFSKPSWPKMAFIEHHFSGDPTNWWLANESAMQAMLRTAGFEIISQPLEETFIAKKSRSDFAVAASWNRSEYLSAIQLNWKDKSGDKTKRK